MRSLAVIMSIYKNDRLKYVKESVGSILNQTYSDLDFYIIYDGPVAEEIDDYLARISDHRLHITRRDNNLGLAQSLNDLLNIVLPLDYEYIARMDADDVSLPNRFAKQVEFLAANPAIDCVGGAINEIDENGISRNKTVKYPCTPQECRSFFAKRNPVAHPSVMFRKSYFAKINGIYPTDFERNEDTRLWHEGYKHGCLITNIPDVVLNFRISESTFKQRRNGTAFAQSQLKLRRLIASDLGFGPMAIVYAYIMYLLMISPSWLLKFAYKVLR
jgi:glycosyltransferase involved in cell wall biosynthesis